MPMKREEIIDDMLDTIAVCEQAIKARPSSRRDFELTLVSSGMEIVEIQNEQQALAWT